jgi:hypothetical protein
LAICKYCELEMHTADGCVKLPVKTIDGEYDPIPYGSELNRPAAQSGMRHHGVVLEDPPRCHDCCVLPGHYLHVGCDWEECPRCHDQLIGCECDPDAIESSTPEEPETQADQIEG